MTKTSLIKIINSVELNTWTLHALKSVQILLVYPIIYNYLNAEESATWMILLLFVSIQNLFDLGFQNVFIRITSQANTGNWSLLKGAQVQRKINEHDKIRLLSRIDTTIKFVYSALTILFLLLLTSFGTIYINQRATQLSLENFSLIYWGIFVLGLIISFFNRRYTSYLIGIELLYLIKRIESIINLFSITIGLGFFLLYPGLLTLIINFTFWQLITHVIFRVIFEKHKTPLKKTPLLDFEIFKFVFPMAWKGTVSSFSSYGLVTFFTLWFGSYANAKDIVSFTYALKILDSIRLFSRVPFYSNIPSLNAIRISKTYHYFFKSILKNIQRCNLLFILFVLGFHFIGFNILELYSKSFTRVEDIVWGFLCVAYYLHLNGAFHTHIYSMTNRVNSHISDSLSAVIILTILFLFFDKDDLYLFPVALIVGYGLFYLPWALFFSSRVINRGFLKLIFYSGVIPFFILLPNFNSRRSDYSQ